MSLCLLTQLTQALTDSETEILIRSIFGTIEPQAVVQVIEQVCQRHCRQSIAVYEFWEVSVSFTVGLELSQGERIVIKFRSPDNTSLAALCSACEVQQFLAAQGFPAPQVLLIPFEEAGCFVSVEQLLDAGENGNAHHPQIRRAMASGLAQQIQLSQLIDANRLELLSELPHSRFHPIQLWEKPHNALFDFEKTAVGAEWIDTIAASAQQVLRSYEAPLVIGHMDWSVKNMRFQTRLQQNSLQNSWQQNSQLSAVYDWDSLRFENELIIVGNAAKGFLTTWYLDVGTVVPTMSEAEQFIQDYEATRVKPFTPTEQQVIWAALLYSMAYTARCEHALDPAGEKLDGSFRAGLRDYAKTYA